MSGAVRTPQFRVTVNGLSVNGVQSVQVRQANAFQCAKFRVTKAFIAGEPMGPFWWVKDQQTAFRVVISASLDGKAWTPLITGNVDSHSVDFLHGTLELVGRDLAALLIDQRTTQSYRNMTSSEIATALAEANGLTPVVTPTTTIVGRYYAQDHDKLSGGDFTRETNQWDLLCTLGSREGYWPHVIGTTLYFQKPVSPPPELKITCQQGQDGVIRSNVSRLTCDRSLTVARDVDVTVRSWNSRNKRVIVGHSVCKLASGHEESGISPTKYIFSVPNLTKAQADAAAYRIAKDITRHERRISISLPADLTITPEHVVRLTGTGTDCDILYWPETVTTTMSVQGGAVTEIEAKYRSPALLEDAPSGAVVESLS